jgi:hypothetical protein
MPTRIHLKQGRGTIVVAEDVRTVSALIGSKRPDEGLLIPIGIPFVMRGIHGPEHGMRDRDWLPIGAIERIEEVEAEL